MSQTKLHKLTIRNKEPGQISKGANTEILLDGKPLKMVKFLKLEFHPRRLTKVQLEMYVDLEDVEVVPTLENYDTEQISERFLVEKYRTKKE